MKATIFRGNFHEVLAGDDTPGEWKTAEEILLDINEYWDNPDRDANIHGWYDLHARLA